MRPISALLLAALPVSFATATTDNQAHSVEMGYFYDVAVFEVTVPHDFQPTFDRFGRPVTNPDDVHMDVGPTRVDSAQYREFDVGALADTLRQTAKPRLVANAAIPKGETVRFPCGIGSNVDLDFTNAAGAADEPSTIVARYHTMFVADREVADMAIGLMGSMTTAGEAPIRFVAHEGETSVVTMLRNAPEGQKEGCIALIRP